MSLDIQEAWGRIRPFVCQRFEEFIPSDDMTLMRRNKGRAGQLMEKAIGLLQGSWLLDFADGDLKTYKSNSKGYPRETMAIHQIGREFDLLVDRQPFLESPVHIKTRQMIVLGICKDAVDPGNWFISVAHFVDARPGTPWYGHFERSYVEVLNELAYHLENDDRLFHTSSGTYLQIRTKDSQPYHPVFSTILGRQVCNKNIAFYFQKQFMCDLVNNSME